MNSVEYLSKLHFNLTPTEIKILNHLDSDRFTINLNSEHPEILRAYSLYLLYYVQQPKNIDKTIHVYSGTNYANDYIRKMVVTLSYKTSFPLLKNNSLCVSFGNAAKIKFYRLHHYMSQGANRITNDIIDLCLCVNVAAAGDYAFVDFFKIYMKNFTLPNTRLILSSCPGSKREFLFNRILFSAELPENDPNKNTFSALRVYFWEYMNVDGEWCKNKIREIGEKEFNLKYQLLFITYIFKRQRSESTMRSENKGRPKKKIIIE